MTFPAVYIDPRGVLVAVASDRSPRLVVVLDERGRCSVTAAELLQSHMRPLLSPAAADLAAVGAALHAERQARGVGTGELLAAYTAAVAVVNESVERERAA